MGFWEKYHQKNSKEIDKPLAELKQKKATTISNPYQRCLCGYWNRKEDIFCLNCGKMNPHSDAVQYWKKRRISIAITVIGVFLIALIVFWWFPAFLIALLVGVWMRNRLLSSVRPLNNWASLKDVLACIRELFSSHLRNHNAHYPYDSTNLKAEEADVEKTRNVLYNEIENLKRQLEKITRMNMAYTQTAGPQAVLKKRIHETIKSLRAWDSQRWLIHAIRHMNTLLAYQPHYIRVTEYDYEYAYKVVKDIRKSCTEMLEHINQVVSNDRYWGCLWSASDTSVFPTRPIFLKLIDATKILEDRLTIMSLERGMSRLTAPSTPVSPSSLPEILKPDDFDFEGQFQALLKTFDHLEAQTRRLQDGSEADSNTTASKLSRLTD